MYARRGKNKKTFTKQQHAIYLFQHIPMANAKKKKQTYHLLF
jgi:hypothetical protein